MQNHAGKMKFGAAVTVVLYALCVLLSFLRALDEFQPNKNVLLGISLFVFANSLSIKLALPFRSHFSRAYRHGFKGIWQVFGSSASLQLNIRLRISVFILSRFRYKSYFIFSRWDVPTLIVFYWSLLVLQVSPVVTYFIIVTFLLSVVTTKFVFEFNVHFIIKSLQSINSREYWIYSFQVFLFFFAGSPEMYHNNVSLHICNVWTSILFYCTVCSSL